MSFGLRLKRYPKDEIARRVQEAARILDITELLERKPRQLSGGQRQRVAMGRAIVRNPKVFLFDEPLSNLDAKLRVQMRTEIKRVHQKVRTTTVYVTHDQVEAMTLADRVVVMNRGKIEQIGAPNDLYHAPKTRFVAGFIGSPAMNFIPCRLEEANGALQVRLSDQIVLPVPAARVARYRPHVGREGITFGLRPEHLTEAKPNGGKPHATIDTVLEVTEPLGMETLVFFTIKGIDVCGRVRPQCRRARRRPHEACGQPRQHAPDRRRHRGGALKLALFQAAGSGDVLPGLLTERGVVSIADAVKLGHTPQLTMQGIIDDFERLRPALERRAADGEAIPTGAVRLQPPLPRPGKILACIANYWEHAQREARPLNMFMKNPDAVVGPGDTIMLPEYTVPWIFMHEAELALVIKGPAKMVKADDWRKAVFGYTSMIDVSAREQGRRTWPATPLTSWLGKSFDTFAPIGPCITTADEIENPNDLIVRFWNDGQLRHNYNTDDMEHRVPALVEFATTVMTMNSGDLIACGTNHEGLGALQDGETVEIEIEKIGRMQLKVTDPLKRSWERGIYMGTDSTNPDAVRRHRPKDA